MTNSRPSIARFLWNHNPFYVISALLMLYSVRKSYGELDIGTINVWAMMGVLSAYTIVLAMIGVLIVRWGKVWDDARSILLVLLLPKVANYIVSSSGDAVSDGVARLRWFAARFQELSKVESGGLS